MALRDLDAIHLGSMTLAELLEAGRRPVPGQACLAGDPTPARIVDAWANVLVPDDRKARSDEEVGAILERRLQLAGLTRDGAIRLLERASVPEVGPRPGWLDLLGEVALRAAGTDWTGPAALMDGCGLPVAAALPRTALALLPFVEVASSRLRGLPHGREVEPRVLEPLRTALLVELHFFASEVLDAVASPPPAPEDPGVRFLVEHGPLGFLPFFRAYPALARLLATRTAFWVEAVEECLSRLDEDRPELARTFSPGAPLGRLARLEPLQADSHHRGRTVLAASFEGGPKLVYKPKSVRLDRGFHDLVRAFGAREPRWAMVVPRIVDRGGYGWLEFVERAPCRDAVEVRDYYRRSGVVLCAAYLLRSRDLHHENVIARGPDPVLIDLEVSLQPALGGGPTIAGPGAEDALDDSVYSTNLLPAWSFDVELSGAGEQVRVADVNAFGNHEHAAGGVATGSVPLLDGEAQPSRAHVDEIVEGFRTAYRVLTGSPEARAEVERILEGLGDAPARTVIRPTQFYSDLLRHVRALRFLVSGLARSLQLEAVFSGNLEGDAVDRARLEKLYPAFLSEIDAMAVGDVPFFACPTSSVALTPAAGPPIPDFFEESGLARARRVLAATSEADLELQCRIIRSSFETTAEPGDPAGLRLDRAALVRPDPGPDRPELPERLAAEARRLAGALANGAVRRDGSIAWIVPHRFEEFDSRKAGLGTAGHSLFSGTAGVLPLFAALEASSPGGGHAPVIDRCVAMLDQALSRLGPRVRPHADLAEGVPGILHAASWSARVLPGVPALARLAGRAFEAMLPVRPEDHDRPDVLTGTAGVVLALLSYHRLSGSAEALRLGTDLGDGLLRAAEAPGPGALAWRVTGRLLSGFAHGAAGIASTLVRLHEATGREDYRRAALSAFRYEIGLFDRGTRRWPDLRRSGPRDAGGLMVGWCTGAPGVLLALLDLLELSPGAGVVELVAAGVEGIFADLPDVRRDHLCCGKTAGLEALGEVARRTRDADLLARTRRAAVALVDRARAEGGYYLDEICPRSERFAFPAVGLFEGLGGIAYAWLRLSQEAPWPGLLSLR